METNGSPPPIFKTDENQCYFLVTKPIHPEATRKITLKEKSSSEKTHQLELKTHQLEEFSEKDKLPNELKLKIEKLNNRSKNEDVKSTIYAVL